MAINQINENIDFINKTFRNEKFNDITTKNLLSNFNHQADNSNLEDLGDYNLLSKSSIPPFKLEQISNDIFNKFNSYKQLLNFKEDVNYEFQSNCQVFLKNIEKMILEIFKYNDISLIKNSIMRIEGLIIQNQEKFKDLKGTLANIEVDKKEFFTQSNEKRLKVREYVTFLKTLSGLFIFLEKNLNFNLDEEKKNLIQVNSFLQVLSDFSFKIFENNNQDFLNNLKFDEIFKTDTQNSNLIEMNTTKSSNKSVSSHLDDENTKIYDKVKKVYKQNFFQFYFVKEDGIYMKTYASKGESLKCTKKYKYYELKFKLNHEELSKDINSNIKSILNLFSKYIIAYKEDSNKKTNQYTKIIIAGVSLFQIIMKKKLTRILKQVKKDCLIKISIFSTISSCFKKTLRKCLDKKKYHYYMNF